MTLTRGARRSIAAAVCMVVGAVYVVAWLAPAIGLFGEDAVYLETAKSLAAGHGYAIESLPTPIPQTAYPPLWPAVLALFVLVSENPLWLKLPAMLCTAGWLLLSYKLLRKLGASPGGAFALVAIVAASPGTVFVSAHLLAEPVFALLITASLLALLDDRAVAAGAFAGLSTITRSEGAPLVVASVLVLVLHRRLRSAALLTGAALVMVAPWLGWSMAHASKLPGLAGMERLTVFAMNIGFVLGAPFQLLSGVVSIYAGLVTLALCIWALIRRRQLIPDLFLGLYCAMLLIQTEGPARFITPVFVLVLWVVWRAFQNVDRQELLAACLIIAMGVPVWVDLERVPDTRRFGEFPASGRAPNDWSRMQLLFAYLRNNTPADALVMANLDAVFFLNTGHKTIRGFSASPGPVTPDQLALQIVHNGVGYVALTPDRDFPEAAAYRHAVEALVRGGMLEPVVVPGAGTDYRLLRTATFRVNH